MAKTYAKINTVDLTWGKRLKLIVLFLLAIACLVPVFAIITHGIVELWQMAWGIW